jgi:AcrR family transcriptional regulator
MEEMVEGAPRPRRASPRAAATKDRIVEAADGLMFVRGVNATTLDDVRAASGTSKSQLYNAFPDKEALVRAVVERRSQVVIDRETGRLATPASFSGLVRWRNASRHSGEHSWPVTRSIRPLTKRSCARSTTTT